MRKTPLGSRRSSSAQAARKSRAGRSARAAADPPLRGREAALRIVREESEHAVLLREVHHRVRNNLQVLASLLNLEVGRAASPEVVRLVHILQDRLRAVALVHDQLHRSRALGQVDLRAYASAVLDGVRQSYDLSARGIDLRLRGGHGQIGMNDALRVGLILNELVANAVVHGFPERRTGRIAVSLSLRPSARVLLTVSNTGVPLPAHFHPPSDRLGLAIVCNIARNSGGRFEWSRRGGASFHVELKQS